MVVAIFFSRPYIAMSGKFPYFQWMKLFSKLLTRCFSTCIELVIFPSNVHRFFISVMKDKLVSFPTGFILYHTVPLI